MRNDSLAFLALQAEQKAENSKDQSQREKYEAIARCAWLLFFARYGSAKK